MRRRGWRLGPNRRLSERGRKASQRGERSAGKPHRETRELGEGGHRGEGMKQERSLGSGVGFSPLRALPLLPCVHAVLSWWPPGAAAEASRKDHNMFRHHTQGGPAEHHKKEGGKDGSREGRPEPFWHRRLLPLSLPHPAPLLRAEARSSFPPTPHATTQQEGAGQMPCFAREGAYALADREDLGRSPGPPAQAHLVGCANPTGVSGLFRSAGDWALIATIPAASKSQIATHSEQEVCSAA